MKQTVCKILLAVFINSYFYQSIKSCKIHATAPNKWATVIESPTSCLLAKKMVRCRKCALANGSLGGIVFESN